jgi:hypothetical protein
MATPTLTLVVPHSPQGSDSNKSNCMAPPRVICFLYLLHPWISKVLHHEVELTHFQLYHKRQHLSRLGVKNQIHQRQSHQPNQTSISSQTTRTDEINLLKHQKACKIGIKRSNYSSAYIHIFIRPSIHPSYMSLPQAEHQKKKHQNREIKDTCQHHKE